MSEVKSPEAKFSDTFYTHIKKGDGEISGVYKAAKELAKSRIGRHYIRTFIGIAEIPDEWDFVIGEFKTSYIKSISNIFGDKRLPSALKDKEVIEDIIGDTRKKVNKNNDSKYHCWMMPSVNILKNEEGEPKRIIPQVAVEHYTDVFMGEIRGIDKDIRKINVDLVYFEPSQDFYRKVLDAIGCYVYGIDEFLGFYNTTRRASGVAKRTSK